MIFVNKYIYNIFGTISISIILRMLLLNEYGDTTLDNEWGTLFFNLKHNNILAFRSFDDVLLPTVYMPPLYIYFIYVVDFLIFNEEYLVTTILIIQILLSAVSTYTFYKINLIFFSKKISLISSYIFCFFPLYIYSTLQISSISIQILLSLIFLFFILKIMCGSKNFVTIIALGFISGLSMLLRGEFILIFLFSITYLIYLKLMDFKKLLIIILITIVTISPYLVRNYLNFQKVTITKSFGYNLWKGNNIDSTVEGSESFKAFNSGGINQKIQNLEKNNLYDFNYDQIFLNYSIEFIKKDPILFVKRYLKKFFSFTFFNISSNYPSYYNFLNILPSIFLSIFFMLSIFFAYQKKSTYNYLVFNLFLTIAIFSLFFILPRYKLIILPTQLIIINFLLAKYFRLGQKN